MTRITRRRFVAGTACGVGTAMLGRARAQETKERPRKGTDLVALGRTGIRTTRMGLDVRAYGVEPPLRGGSSLPPPDRPGSETFQRPLSPAPTRLAPVDVSQVVRHAIARGIRYFDTSDQSGTRLALREPLRSIAREAIFLQTQTRARSAELARADIDRVRRELGVDYLDSLLLADLTVRSWPADLRPVIDVLQEAKAKGRVKAVGVVCRSLEALEASVDRDWIDLQLLGINRLGAWMAGPVKEVVRLAKAMHDKGRGVLGTAIAGGPGAASADRLQSLKFVLGLGCVDAVAIECRTPQEIDDNLFLIGKALA